MQSQELLLMLGVLVPLVSFVALALFGSRLGKPLAGYVAVAGILLSTVCATIVLVQWHWLGVHEESHPILWASLGAVELMFGVNLDSLTVIMFFMVTVVSTCIFVFSLGYMAGHSDEIDGRSEYHRFFTYLSLFCFSMLGLVISNSLLFMFVFWELVGVCSYLLIGFYFHKKSASNAAIKAFVVNRVGDFGFIIGLAMVFSYLGDLSLDGAAVAFREQSAVGGPLFEPGPFGIAFATWMGILLFCGAIGKSAQFPLHVWLPDAMEGPTPVSALIHAATMVAAGVYLVARIFVLLTPGAQMFVAVIGCITLTMAALIAIVQTDIKRVLAYSTLSQLGYMIFGMGVGAWIGALFHLLTHAFFKALLFLGSGQVIEGCHHEQDIRRMGGLRHKMPVTCWTFFIAVLAISGVGIPMTSIGLGGFFSKDEILAVAWHRAYGEEHQTATADAAGLLFAAAEPAHGGPATAHDAATGDPDDHGHAGTAAHAGKIPSILFWLPIFIAYVTPLYMMRCWWLTFMGKPRDEHVYEHAHESKLMYLPLVALAAGTFVAGYVIFRPMVAGAAPTGFLVPTFDGHASEAADAHGALIDHAAHSQLAFIVGPAFLVGFAIAIGIYRGGLGVAATIANRLRPIHTVLVKKFYFDEVYGVLAVGGTMVIKSLCDLFDRLVIDGLVNLSGAITERLSAFSGWVLDMRGAVGAGSPEPKGRGLGFVAVVSAVAAVVLLVGGGNVAAALFIGALVWLVLGIDGVANDLGQGAWELAGVFRRAQTGRIRNYVMFAAGGAAVALIIMIVQRNGY